MPAPEVERRLQEIAETRGRLEAEEVVEDARPPDSPLHDEFDWDNSVAGHKWRLQQARALIRSVRYQTVTTKSQVSAVKYIRDPDRPSGYVATASLRTEDDKAKEALKAEVDRILSLIERSIEVAEVLELEDDFKRLHEAAEALLGRIEDAVA